MNKQLLAIAAVAGSVWLTGGAQAALVTFDNPGLVELDFDANTATYTEAGLAFTGRAFDLDFLILEENPGDASDQVLVGGFQDFEGNTGPISLTAVGGGLFSLLSLDLAFYDLVLPAGLLTIDGLLDGLVVASTTVTLMSTGFESLRFGADWRGLSQVNFLGSSGFALDNISTVPEPGSLALAGLGLLGALGGLRAGRRQRLAAARTAP